VIGRIRGVLLEKHPPHLLVDVQGVGYEVEAPMTTFCELPALGTEVTLHTHHHVREEAETLFGFRNVRERNVFRMLLRVNGVGAKLALAILSGMDGDSLARCVYEGDTASLARLPGIGRKTAERLVMEMRDRLGNEPPETVPSVSGGAPVRAADPVAEAVSALVALGFKPQEASRQVHAVETRDLSSEEIVRRALQSLVS